MHLRSFINFLLTPFRRKQPKSLEVSVSPIESSIYPESPPAEEVYNLWDYLEFVPNTQAHHITKVVGFEEWVSMEEILRRIQELFGVSYKNIRSLYAYVKTLVDCGLFESTNIGGKRKWRKRDLIIKLQKKKEKKKVAALQVS